MKIIYVSGKRKRAIARAYLRAGGGKIKINKVLLDNYKPEMFRLKLTEPLILAGDVCGKVDIEVKVKGGGIASQASAARLCIARALAQYDKKLTNIFLEYDRNLLVADVRRKEPAKPNRHGQARAKKQKSYR